MAISDIDEFVTELLLLANSVAKSARRGRFDPVTVEMLGDLVEILDEHFREGGRPPKRWMRSRHAIQVDDLSDSALGRAVARGMKGRKMNPRR